MAKHRTKKNKDGVALTSNLVSTSPVNEIEEVEEKKKKGKKTDKKPKVSGDDGPKSCLYTGNYPARKAMEDQFRKDYEFKKQIRAREVVDPWEKSMKTSGISMATAKERNLISGAAHTYSGTKMLGRERISGNKSAHRIGKR